MKLMVMLLYIIPSCFYVLDASAQVSVALQYDVSETRSITLPDGVTSVTMQGWGGGGGGGYSSSNGQTTGGGGGGAYAKDTAEISLAGGNRALELTVGAGGSGGSGTGNGGASSVTLSGKRYLNAVGGNGVHNNSESGGAGGKASSCEPQANAYSGGNGGNGNGDGGTIWHNSGGGGGAAGSTSYGSDGRDGFYSILLNSNESKGGTGGFGGGNGGDGAMYEISGSGSGFSGKTPGGGGGGGKSPNASGGFRPGGDGGTGRIIISLTISPPNITSNGNCYSPNRKLPLILTSSCTSTAAQGVSYQWKKDGTNIPGATSASLNVTGAGNYTLSVAYAFTSDIYGTTANAMQVTSNTYQVYPEPTATLSPDSVAVCKGESAGLAIAMTGKAPWLVTVTCSDGSANYRLSGISATPYTFSVSPAETTAYTLTDVSDSICPAGDVSGESKVTVHPFPRSGAIYRLPNDQ